MRFWPSKEGIAAVEFALIMPVFLMVFVGLVDVGMMLYKDYQLDQAVAAGEQYAVLNAASVSSTGGATLASNVASAVENANGTAWAGDVVVVNNGPTETVSNGTATASGTASNADSCYCPSGSPPSWTWGSAMTCGASCSGNGTAGKYVTITATIAYTPILTMFGMVPSTTLRQSATVQTQ
jgi:Flp pilus assembly protein TadG